MERKKKRKREREKKGGIAIQTFVQLGHISQNLEYMGRKSPPPFPPPH